MGVWAFWGEYRFYAHDVRSLRDLRRVRSSLAYYFSSSSGRANDTLLLAEISMANHCWIGAWGFSIFIVVLD